MQMESTVLIVGEGSLPVHCARTLERGGHRIAGVCSIDAALKVWAESRGVVHFGDVASFSSHAGSTPHDYLFSVANFELLSESLLACPRQFAVNYHDGPLPRYAGVYATSWAILNGEPSHGITWHVMTSKVDAGDILEQTMLPVAKTETAYSLNFKCYLAAAQAFTRLAAKLKDGTFTRTPQDLGQRTYFSRKKWPPVLSPDCTEEERDRHKRAMDMGNKPGPAPRPVRR